MTTYKCYAHSNINKFVNMQPSDINVFKNVPSTKLPIFVMDDFPYYNKSNSKRCRNKYTEYRHKKLKHNRGGKRYFDDYDYGDELKKHNRYP